MEIRKRMPRYVALAVFVLAGLILTPDSPVQAGQTDLIGPPGSGGFGTHVAVLPNGNIVVTDPYFDAGSTVDVGAVYLYDGVTGTLISTLIGSTADDRVGSGGVMVLSNGNYVVRSSYWDNGGATDAGAVTWGNGTTGISGVVSSANSLVGSTTDDRVGFNGVTALNNGNYVVISRYWSDGGMVEVGAVTWGDGATGISGVVSSSNSLVGSWTDDWVGRGGVTELSNGNYVVCSWSWDGSNSATQVGAVTWGNGTSGVSGVVSSGNSLVGSNGSNDSICQGGVIPLPNGHYVVSSPSWRNGGADLAGAVTWGNGTTGITGLVSSANSLVGTATGDQIGHVTVLSNGNYVVSSSYWDNGGTINVGAVIWADGATGITGTVSSANSLIGSVAGDQVGFGGVTALSNGNYVVSSLYWNDSGVADAGAVTWMNGTIATGGVVSSVNSLVGTTANDFEDGDVLPLSNGNYVVISPYWDNGGIVDAGAVTWVDGTTSTSGVVSSANSLVGSTADDRIGYSDVALVRSVTALINGNYVVGSYHWDNGGVVDAGAVTWGNGTTGTNGVVSAANSLVGSSVDDQIGRYGVVALSNGNYVARSYRWNNGGMTDAGAVTWGNGATGIIGTISSANSLVGSSVDDQVGSAVVALSNGNYVVRSYLWDDGGVMNVGAVTWGNGATGISGAVSSSNSLVGSTANDRVGSDNVTEVSSDYYVVNSPVWDNSGAANAGAVTMAWVTSGVSGLVTDANSVRGTAAGGGSDMVFAYDSVNDQLVVGRPADNTVTLFRLYRIYLPLVINNAGP